MTKKNDEPKPEGSSIGVVKVADDHYQIVKMRFRGRQLLGWDVLADNLVYMDVKLHLKIAMARFVNEYEA